MDGNLGRPIACGRTAEIHTWQEGQVLKLFRGWVGPESIEREARIARAIHAGGLPVPAVGEIVRLDGRDGLIYERVDGVPMWESFSRKPWKLLYYARRTAELHVEMHARTIQTEIPSQRQKLVSKIQHAEVLPAHLRSEALAALGGMPDGDRLCHGDFHPGNILITRKGESIIDWIDSACGNPLADLARTTILLLGAAGSRPRALVQKAIVRIFHAAYIRHYFRLRPGGEDEYGRWLPIVAAARLSEEIPDLEKWLIARVEYDIK